MNMNKNNYENGYVQICVTCCQVNSQNSKTLPLVCPKINMPCLAIDPKYIIPKISEEMVIFLSEFNEGNGKARIPIDCKYIDSDFVKTRCNAFTELSKLGNKTIYTMKAY